MKNLRLLHALSLANRNPRIGGMCLGLIASLLMSPFAYFATSDILFLFDGEQVNARIVAPPTIVRTKFSACYRYALEYEDGQGVLRSGVGLLRDGKLAIGDIIPVRYLRKDPARSRSEYGLRHSWPTRLFALLAVLILVASVWTGGKGIREIVRELSDQPGEGYSPLPQPAEPSQATEPKGRPVSNGDSSTAAG